MKEELVSGLKNAMEHGSTLEQAVSSLINAGYSLRDVTDAAGAISPVGIPIENQSSFEPVKEFMPVPLPSINSQFLQQDKKRNWLIISLVGILLLIIVGIILMLFYGEQITGYFS